MYDEQALLFAWLQDEEEGAMTKTNCVVDKPDDIGKKEGERKPIEGSKYIGYSYGGGIETCTVNFYWHFAQDIEEYDEENDVLTVYHDEYETGWYEEEKYAEMNKVLIQSFGLVFGHIDDCLTEEIRLKGAENRIEEFFASNPVSTDLRFLFDNYYSEYCAEYGLMCSGSGRIEETYPEEFLIDLSPAIIAKQGSKYIFRLYRLLRKGGKKAAFKGTKLFGEAGEVLFDFTDDAIKGLKMIPEGGEVLGVTDNIVKFTDEAGNNVEKQVQLIVKDGEIGFRKVVGLAKEIDNIFYKTVDEFAATFDPYNKVSSTIRGEAFNYYKQGKWAKLEELFKINKLNGGWPPANGGYNIIDNVTIKKGMKFDRYQVKSFGTDSKGNPILGGSYTSPIKGSSYTFEQRALENKESSYGLFYEIKVVNDLPFTTMDADVIPWHGKVGGGKQNYWKIPIDPNTGYPKTWNKLAEEGYIKITIKNSPNGQYSSDVGKVIGN